MIEKLNPNDWDMEKTINKINEIIDHLPQEKDIEFKEKVLIQMTKAVRLLTDEGYNQALTNPMHEIINELRKELNVQRVKTDTEEKIIKQPTKEVPDIRPILERLYNQGHYDHSPYGAPNSVKEEMTIDKAIQEISALYKRGNK